MVKTIPAAPVRAEGRGLSRGAVVSVVVVCTLLAFALRVFLAARSGLWRDEALFLFIVRSPSAGAMLEFLRLHESHPPLFYLLMRVWLNVFGDSETAALALPVLLGALLIPVIYLVGARVFSPTAGLVAALLAALSGALAENAALVRPYSLLPLLCLLSVFFLWESLNREGAPADRLRPWLAYGCATLALLYTHNWSWLVLGAQWAVVVLCWKRRPAGERIGWRGRVLREWACVQAMVLTAYAPWLPSLIYQAQHAGHGLAKLPRVFPSLSQFATILVPLPYDYAGFVCLALIAFLAGRAAISLRRGRPGAAANPDAGDTRRRTTALLLFLGVPCLAFAAALALNARSLLLLPRCLTMLAPCALLVFAYAVASLPGRPVVRLLAVTVTAMGFVYVSLLLLTQVKSNARELAGAVAAKARPSDLIVITPEQLASSFNFYYKAGNPQINFPHEGRQEATTFDDWVSRCADRQALARVKQRLAQARRENQRVWLILASGLYLKGVPDDDEMLPRSWLTTNVIGVVRSSQLLEHLIRLYGPPDRGAVPGDRRDGEEILTALLFEPGPSEKARPAGSRGGDGEKAGGRSADALPALREMPDGSD